MSQQSRPLARREHDTRPTDTRRPAPRNLRDALPQDDPWHTGVTVSIVGGMLFVLAIVVVVAWTFYAGNP